MNKQTIMLLMIMFCASPAMAQQLPGDTGPEEVLEGMIGLTYTGISSERSSRAGEYEYLHSSAGGDLHVEWVPLPHRFSLEGHALNRKDYFSEMDYAYHDIVLFNFLERGIYHNLDHYSFGTDDPATTMLRFIDLNPGDQYGIENSLRKGFIRFKTPDFPFHLYAGATRVDRSGTMQQRFLSGDFSDLNKVSQSRVIDWSSTEVRTGMNSHLGPLEFDYNHAEKKFTASGDKVLYDQYLFMTPHNLVPDLTSFSDTVKLHSSLNGRLVVSATFTEGKKKNEDSDAKTNFRNAAGDIVITPVAGLTLFLKYRHYELSLNNPDTVTTSGIVRTYAVRDSISSKKDMMTGSVRYRLTERMTVKGEYAIETIERNAWYGDSIAPLQIAPVQTGTAPNYWDAAHRTTKTTEKIGISYRAMNSLSVRADYTAVQISNPAYAADPDRVNSANAAATWTPVRWVIALASYGGVREKRDGLSAPLAGGSRKTNRDQGLGSVTFLVGKRSSVTASALYYQNKAKETLTYRDAAGLPILGDTVPYADIAQVYSVTVTHALSDRVTLTAEGSKSTSRGDFRNNGSVVNTTGIDFFSDMRVVEDIYTAGLETQLGKNMSSELRYQQRRYDDKIDNSQDGRVNIIMASVAVKW
ncbi:MAG: hypothetical protein M0R70_02135 [Nitrospirae bacterium]|nr:hypothetical protein [Nitrospirota bacterium]